MVECTHRQCLPDAWIGLTGKRCVFVFWSVRVFLTKDKKCLGADGWKSVRVEGVIVSEVYLFY